MPKSCKKISSFTQAEITRLFKDSRVKVRYSGMRILTAPSDSLCARVLIVTPRTCGKAPERNLFRRRIRSLFRENNLATKGLDYIVITDKRGVGIPFDKLRQLLLCASQPSSDKTPTNNENV